MAFDEIILKGDDGIAEIILNQPDKANALSRRMVAELSQALDQVAHNPRVSVLIIGAAGKHFCAGHLLDEMVDESPAVYEEIFRNCSAMMERLPLLDIPVIARVRGAATAAGCQLAATCDLVMAGKSARFCTPGVRLGLFCGTPAVPLVRAVGRKRALEMLMTGRWVQAEEALLWGLVNQVIEDEYLEAKTQDLARFIAKASPKTLAMGKRAFHRQVDMSRSQAMDYASGVMALNLNMEDAQEGIKAYLEKRKPVWKGR